jgi:prophage regulatory protein
MYNSLKKGDVNELGRAVDREFVSALDLEEMTGTKASTWRYWASIGQGPPSCKLGRRRVWKLSSALTWLAEQEAAATARGGVQ